jgi:hypothetical protein
MSRFTIAGGSGTPGPQGPAGQDADTANFTFDENTMNTNEDMTIGVLGVPGEINLSAYAGVNIQTHADFGLTTNKVITSSNGATDNIKIGDDAYVGDGNVANNIVIKGQQNATQGGIVLGSAKTEKVSSNGSDLSLNANNDIILYPGSSYAYIGTPQIDGSNRVAKISDITNSTSVMKFVSSTPAHDHGAAGDKKNSFAYDDTHLFICTADYVNNSTVIWKRINWAGGNW